MLCSTPYIFHVQFSCTPPRSVQQGKVQKHHSKTRKVSAYNVFAQRQRTAEEPSMSRCSRFLLLGSPRVTSMILWSMIYVYAMRFNRMPPLLCPINQFSHISYIIYHYIISIIYYSTNTPILVNIDRINTFSSHTVSLMNPYLSRNIPHLHSNARPQDRCSQDESRHRWIKKQPQELG